MRAIFTVLVVGLVAAFLVPGLGTASSVPTLTVVVEGNGRVTSSDQKVDCRDKCTVEYPNQGTVELTAFPAENESFIGWSEDCQGTTKCTVTMNEDRTVKANFSGASPQPSSTATSEPSTSPTPTSEPSASPTPTSEPSASPSPTPTAAASPDPTPTPGPSAQSPGEIAAHLIGRARAVRAVRPQPAAMTISADRRFVCRRECLVSAVLRDRTGKKRTLARGSRMVRAGGSPGVRLRFGSYGRAKLKSGRRRARLTISVQNGGPVARRSRAVTLRVKG